MKRKQQTYRTDRWIAPLLSIFLMLVAGCNNEMQLNGQGNGASTKGTLTLRLAVKDPVGIQTRVLPTEPGTGDENRVTNLGVWGFKETSGGDYTCTFFKYFPTDELPAEAANGDFEATLVGWDDENTAMIAFANLNTIPVETEEIGKAPDRVSKENKTKLLTGTEPVMAPFPMYFLGNITLGVLKLEVPLTRSVARLRVKLSIDETHMQGLKNMLRMDKATMIVKNRVNHCYMLTNGDIGNVEGDWAMLDSEPLAFQVNQDGTYTVPNQYLYYIWAYNWEEEWWTNLQIQIPYTKDGIEYENNYYKTYLYNEDKGPQEEGYHSILANRSYDLTLRVVGLGSDMGLKADLQCVPWNTEEVQTEQGYALEPDVFVSSVSDVYLCQGGYLKQYGDYPVDRFKIRLSGADAANVTIEKTTNPAGQPDWVLRQVGGSEFTEKNWDAVNQSVPVWKAYAGQSLTDKDIKLELYNQNDQWRQTATVHLNAIRVKGKVWMDRELGAGSPNNTGHYFYPSGALEYLDMGVMPVGYKTSVKQIGVPAALVPMNPWNPDRDPCPDGYRIPTADELRLILPPGMNTNLPTRPAGGLSFGFAPGVSVQNNESLYREVTLIAKETATGSQMYMRLGTWGNVKAGTSAVMKGNDTALLFYYSTTQGIGYRHYPSANLYIGNSPLGANNDCFRMRCIRK